MSMLQWIGAKSLLLSYNLSVMSSSDTNFKPSAQLLSNQAIGWRKAITDSQTTSSDWAQSSGLSLPIRLSSNSDPIDGHVIDGMRRTLPPKPLICLWPPFWTLTVVNIWFHSFDDIHHISERFGQIQGMSSRRGADRHVVMARSTGH